MTLTIQLPDHQEAVLTAKAQAQGVSAEEYARQVLAQDLEASPEPRRRHISEIIRENMSRVPKEDLALQHEDGASQIDHYLYGVPKSEL